MAGIMGSPHCDGKTLLNNTSMALSHGNVATAAIVPSNQLLHTTIVFKTNNASKLTNNDYLHSTDLILQQKKTSKFGISSSLAH